MDLGPKLSSKHTKVVILCLMVVKVSVTMAEKDTLWWENYDEASDYQQLMQEEIGKKILTFCQNVCNYESMPFPFKDELPSLVSVPI